MNFMNYFGNNKGLEMVLDVLENAKMDDTLNIQVMGNLATLIALPANIYHRTVMDDFGARIVNSIKARLLGASDKSIRDVRKEQIDTIMKAAGSIQARISDKTQAAKELEVFRLQMCKKCLESEFLERRIQGIRDLNQVIKNNTLYTSKNFDAQFLVNWMTENQVFDIIWTARKTHAQLVERSNEIWRLLLKEKLLTDEHIKMFWELTKTQDFKSGVYKIINESSIYL